MANQQQITRQLDEIGQTLRVQPSVRDDVLRRLTQISVGGDAVAGVQLSTRRRMKRRSLGALLAIAACIAIAFTLWRSPGGGSSIIGAQDAFAAAINTVTKARTFSCREIAEWVDEDTGKPQRIEQAYMFKEPDRARFEHRQGLQKDGEITISDYAKHRRLTLNPKDKTAELDDTSTMFAVDDHTGALRPLELDTDVREKVLKITAQAVKDLGVKNLNGKTVRVLQAQSGASIKTVYLDPQTRAPVQITLSSARAPQSRYTYADIEIDADLDDRLFDLDVPSGYKVHEDPPPDAAKQYNMKMLTKMRNLTNACIEYANNHKGEFPAQLSDLKEIGKSERWLATISAAPDKPDGPPVIVYRKPRATKGTENEIVLYESPEHRRAGQVIAAMADGHAQVLSQAEFDGMMK